MYGTKPVIWLRGLVLCGCYTAHCAGTELLAVTGKCRSQFAATNSASRSLRTSDLHPQCDISHRIALPLL